MASERNPEVGTFTDIAEDTRARVFALASQNERRQLEAISSQLAHHGAELAEYRGRVEGTYARMNELEAVYGTMFREIAARADTSK